MITWCGVWAERALGPLREHRRRALQRPVASAWHAVRLEVRGGGVAELEPDQRHAAHGAVAVAPAVHAHQLLQPRHHEGGLLLLLLLGAARPVGRGGAAAQGRRRAGGIVEVQEEARFDVVIELGREVQLLFEVLDEKCAAVLAAARGLEACESSFWGGFQAPFPPAVPKRLLLSALTAAIA